MGNSKLVVYEKISPNRTSPRNHEIDTISIHCTAGQCSIESLGVLFASASKRASSNYGIGMDGRVGMYVEERDRSWGTSSPSNDNRAITIEVSSDSQYPYAVNDAAYESLIRLLVDICQRNPGIGRLKWSTDRNERMGHLNGCNMTVHRDYANKACPGEYLYSRHGEIAAEVNRRLDAAEAAAREAAEREKEEDEMDIGRFKELWTEMREELQDNDAGEWSEEGRNWAIQTGLILGNGTSIDGEPNYMWNDVLTREQMVVLLYRFAIMMGKA